eukprot:Selendium_serpulae@DN6545_c0_g1_i1.p1
MQRYAALSLGFAANMAMGQILSDSFRQELGLNQFARPLGQFFNDQSLPAGNPGTDAGIERSQMGLLNQGLFNQENFANQGRGYSTTGTEFGSRNVGEALATQFGISPERYAEIRHNLETALPNALSAAAAGAQPQAANRWLQEDIVDDVEESDVKSVTDEAMLHQAQPADELPVLQDDMTSEDGQAHDEDDNEIEGIEDDEDIDEDEEEDAEGTDEDDYEAASPENEIDAETDEDNANLRGTMMKRSMQD